MQLIAWKIGRTVPAVKRAGASTGASTGGSSEGCVRSFEAEVWKAWLPESRLELYTKRVRERARQMHSKMRRSIRARIDAQRQAR